jgi:hypothetical protein
MFTELRAQIQQMEADVTGFVSRIQGQVAMLKTNAENIGNGAAGKLESVVADVKGAEAQIPAQLDQVKRDIQQLAPVA